MFVGVDCGLCKDPKWNVQIKNVALDSERNEVVLWVSNTEARAREPGRAIIVFNKPVRPAVPPLVEIVDPRDDTQVTSPDLTVRFRVRSETPLKRASVTSATCLPNGKCLSADVSW